MSVSQGSGMVTWAPVFPVITTAGGTLRKSSSWAIRVSCPRSGSGSEKGRSDLSILGRSEGRAEVKVRVTAEVAKSRRAVAGEGTIIVPNVGASAVSRIEFSFFFFARKFLV